MNDEVKRNVLLAPVPSWVVPGIVGKAYVVPPDWGSLDAAVTVKLPLVDGW